MIEKLSIPDRKPHLKITEELIEDIKNQAERGMQQQEIAWYLGITPQRWSKLKSIYPALKNIGKKGKARGKARALAPLWTLIDKGDLGAIAFYLKTQHGWTEKKTLDIKHEISKEIPNLKDVDPIEASKIYHQFMKSE